MDARQNFNDATGESLDSTSWTCFLSWQYLHSNENL